MRKYSYRGLLLIVNAVAMILELVAARIITPCFGSSNTVYTIIISMMLLSNAIGNYIGGRLADKYKLGTVNICLLSVSAATISLILMIDKVFISTLFVTSEYGSEKISSLLVIFLFMIPCICIGALSPILNKIEFENIENVGKKSGVIYAIMTVGSLFGTLLGGFVLIPLLGCDSILILISVILILLASYFLPIRDIESKLGNFFISCLILVVSFIFFSNSSELKFYGDKLIDIINTGDSYIRIFEGELNEGEKVRIMNIAGGFESAAYLDEDRRDELVFEYTKVYNEAALINPDFKEFAMIGGGAYSYPRYLVSHFGDKNIDVFEIDPGVTQAAKDYFWLDDFLSEYGSERMGLYNGDGRVLLAESDKKYDVILNDSFSGSVPARSLATKEAVQIIHDHLNPYGIYASNIMGLTAFLPSEIKTISSVFKYVWVRNVKDSDNCIIIASDFDYDFISDDVPITDEDVILTDDYSPVENLSQRKIR